MTDAGVLSHNDSGVTDVGAPTFVPSNGSSTVTLLLVLGAVSFLPMVLLAATSFAKISIVLGMLRNAFGTQQMPSNWVVTALALVLSFHVMAPTLSAMSRAAEPALQEMTSGDVLSGQNASTLRRAWDAAQEPLKVFLAANSTKRDKALFRDLARREHRVNVQAATPIAEDSLAVLLPAFLLSELARAFVMGFLLLLPFLVVDLVIANVLAAAGLQNVSQQNVALPFKLALFLAVDGWTLLVRALVTSYR